jgi:hypothetical protein
VPFGYLAGIVTAVLLVARLAVAGLLGAALVGGWAGSGQMLATCWSRAWGSRSCPWSHSVGWST